MTPPPEAPAVTLPMSTFLTANGVPREWFVAASGAFATWLEQLGPDNTAPAALLHTLETLKAAQDQNAAKQEQVRALRSALTRVEDLAARQRYELAELERLLESARNWAVHLEQRLHAVEALAVESKVPGLGTGVVNADALLRVCAGKPPTGWSDLFGIAPDFTGTASTEEYLEANRGEA